MSIEPLWLPAPFEMIAETLRRALDKHLLCHEAAVFFDISLFKRRLAALRAAFPSNALHAAAVKANPLPALIKIAAECGAGAEAASIAELKLAIRAGVAPQKIAFDSPVKTEGEIEEALRCGAGINADSLAEVERIRRLLDRGLRPGAWIGLRINPQVGQAAVGYSSTAGRYSKFGVALKEHRDEIIRAYVSNPWLSGIHFHIGSQFCPVSMLLEGAKIAAGLRDEINSACGSEQVCVFDIGGGLPAPYRRGENVITAEHYAGMLRERLPSLFQPPVRLITELGRHLHANAGWAVSRVEYVKKTAGEQTLAVHLGADMFLRRCYRPADWHHDIFVTNSRGEIRTGAELPSTIAGPLCFAGDVLARSISLPAAQPGDYAIVCDAGAYTYSMWSYYNSRPMPEVIGYENDCFTTLKKAQTIEEVLRLWS